MIKATQPCPLQLVDVVRYSYHTQAKPVYAVFSTGAYQMWNNGVRIYTGVAATSTLMVERIPRWTSDAAIKLCKEMLDEAPANINQTYGTRSR